MVAHPGPALCNQLYHCQSCCLVGPHVFLLGLSQVFLAQGMICWAPHPQTHHQTFPHPKAAHDAGPRCPPALVVNPPYCGAPIGKLSLSYALIFQVRG